MARFKSLKAHHGWRFKNLTLVFMGLLVAYWLGKQDWFQNFLIQLGGLGYIGSFLAGMLFVSTFTVATGAIILFKLTPYLNPLEIALTAGLGAVLSDLLIFKFVKNNLKDEIEYIFDHNFDGKHVRKIFRTKYFSWSLPVVGAIIIASPLPDELGVGLLSISKMSTLKFLILSFVLNSIGIFLIVVSAAALK